MKKIYRPLDIVYEDENVLFINKPVGMLSQKADKNDCSLVEYITAYLLHNNSLLHMKTLLCSRRQYATALTEIQAA